ncbi:MAG: pcnB [Candidatus Doudnabacteria bacterium]|nr:pcnB [Candidatus Doudnabacteria bacterium]
MLKHKNKFSAYQNLANEICLEFQSRGFVCYWVGGAVRDMLLQQVSSDIDLATNATPLQIKEVVAKKYKIYTIGEKFGTIGVITAEDNIEITTFRAESGYSDSRHPDKVIYAKTAKEDSNRRDFTVNALYWNPGADEVLDFHGGLKDLKAKTLRFVGKAEERIKEDPLRLIRAIRFAAMLDFKIVAKDQKFISKHFKEINKISGQRIKNELDKILLSDNFLSGILLLNETKILKALFPEVDNLRKIGQSNDYHAEGNVFNHTLKALAAVYKNKNDYNLTLRYAVLFHDTGKAFTAQSGERKGRAHVSFHGHAQKSAEAFARIAKRFPFAKAQRKEIAWLLRHHMDLLNITELSEKTLVKLIKNPQSTDLIRLRIADSLGATMTNREGKVIPKNIFEPKNLIRRIQKLQTLYQVNLLNGDDLIKLLKIKSGKEVGFILEKIKTEQIFGRIKNKKEAVAFVTKYYLRK